MNEIYEFDPVEYSSVENAFLLERMGQPPVVAMRGVPAGVNRNAVLPIITRIYELEQLKEHEGQEWSGVEPLKKAIQVWLKENAKWATDARRSKRAPRWPSMYSFDARGKAHRGGPGSDSGRVRTYFGPNGERLPFAVKLIPDDVADWAPPGFTEKPTLGLHEDTTSCRIECQVPLGEGRICGHTESYRADSRSSHAAARARMSKHLRKSTENTDGHREVHTNEFGG